MKRIRTSERPSNGTLVLGTAATLAVGLAPFVRVPDLRGFLLFAVFVALGEMVGVPLPGGTTWSLGLAPALGYAFLQHPVPEVAFCYAAGAGVALGLRRALGRPISVEDLATGGIMIVGAAGAYRAFAAVDPLRPFGPPRISSLGFGAVLALVLVGVAMLKTALAVLRDRIPWLPVLMSSTKATAPLTLAIVSTGGLIALAFPALRAWSLPLFVAPLAATEFSFRQVAANRKAYLQTIRSLSRVPEVAGYTEPGHSERVAALAVAIAREMGVGDPAEIEYAALLHDIGRVSLNDPHSNGSRPLELAAVGAAIVEEAGHFPGVASAIHHQHEPYRRRGEDIDRDPPVGARIIKVASAYDDLTVPPGLGRSPSDALERLYLGMAYEYDPRVIQALARTLEKRGEV